MNKENIKIFALLLVIGTPVFFFLTFKHLTKIPRPKSPPKMFASKDSTQNKTGDSSFHTIPNVKFTAETGQPFEMDSLRGQIFVADFFFASCPGICPVMTSQLERVQRNFIKDAKFKIISISVDPDRDSIPKLREYAHSHNAISGKWSFLRAPKKDVYKLANEGFYIVAKEDKEEGEDGFYHSQKLTLVDQKGIIRGYFNGTDSLEVNKLMQQIVMLLREGEVTYTFRKDPNKSGFQSIKDFFK